MSQQVKVYRNLELRYGATLAGEIEVLSDGRIQQTFGRKLTSVSQGINEQSATKRYALGTRRQIGNRVWYYAQASANEGLRPQYGAYCGNGFPESAAGVAASAGATTVSCTAQAAITADDYAEGWLAVSSGTNKYPFYQIKSNTVQATPGSTTTVTLYDPLVGAITTGSTVTLYKNEYNGVRSVRQYELENPGLHPGTETYIYWLGIPMAVASSNLQGGWGIVTASYYCWIQTWGPCQVAGQDNYGASGFEHRMTFYDDGSVVNESGGTQQPAGFILPCTWWSDAGHDLPGASMMINLTISP